MQPLLSLDLSLPPAERWRGLEPHIAVARSLVDSYVRDLGLKDASALGPWSGRLPLASLLTRGDSSAAALSDCPTVR